MTHPGLGVRLVLVVGARTQINRALLESGHMPQYTDGMRVTDADALQVAIEAAGSTRMEIEARLSRVGLCRALNANQTTMYKQGPAVSMVRRHARSDRSFHYGPAVHVISGNYVAAKRRGVVGGVDYQHTGVVRFVQVDAVRRQLDSGNVVLLSNLGYSAAGEVLNCDAYTVACRAAIDLEADKLLCMTLPSTCPMVLPQWLPLSDAERMLLQMTAPTHLRSLDSALETTDSNGAAAPPRGTAESAEELYDVAKWATYGLPPPLMAAVVACRNGVKRAHLVCRLTTACDC